MVKKILLVEDSSHDAELTLHALKSCSIPNPVIHANDGAVGLRHIAVDADIAVVLLDLKLRTMDGFELLQLMRADPKFVATPVVIISGSGNTADRVRANVLGASGFVQKHFDTQKYADALCAALLPFHYLLKGLPEGELDSVL